MEIIEKTSLALNNPRAVGYKICQLYGEYISPHIRPPDNVFDEDWDNLIILDGCRNDLLSKYDLNGEYETRWSAGADSMEFLKNNLQDKILKDVVYVTANPYVHDYQDSIFKVINVWDEKWDSEYKTVLPKSVAESAREAIDRYPNKRLVVHFMQPHYPFIGPSGENLPNHRTFTGQGRVTSDNAESIWTLLQRGTVTKEDVWTAYEENLEIVLPVALDLINNIDGKSVLTADHGNAFGERAIPIPMRVYGHQKGYHIRSLLEVPWIIFNGERRKITEERIKHYQEEEDHKIEEKLKDLGYM